MQHARWPPLPPGYRNSVLGRPRGPSLVRSLHRVPAVRGLPARSAKEYLQHFIPRGCPAGGWPGRGRDVALCVGRKCDGIDDDTPAMRGRECEVGQGCECGGSCCEHLLQFFSRSRVCARACVRACVCEAYAGVICMCNVHNVSVCISASVISVMCGICVCACVRVYGMCVRACVRACVRVA